MIEFIKIWCEEIIVSVIIATIIEMFVPQGNMKKYIRVIIGIYIIFVILNPIVTNIDDINLDNVFAGVGNYNTMPLSKMEEMSNVYVRAMESKIKKDFTYVSDVRIILSDDLEEVEKIEITLLNNVSSVEELKQNLIKNYRSN